MSQPRTYVGYYQLHYDKREGKWVLFDRRTATIVTGENGLPRSFLTEDKARDWALANSKAVK